MLSDLIDAIAELSWRSNWGFTWLATSVIALVCYVAISTYVPGQHMQVLGYNIHVLAAIVAGFILLAGLLTDLTNRNDN